MKRAKLVYSNCVIIFKSDENVDHTFNIFEIQIWIITAMAIHYLQQNLGKNNNVRERET